MTNQGVNPLAVIQTLNAHTIYKGCFQYACLLQKLFPGSVIYHKPGHCIVKIGTTYYDNEGVFAAIANSVARYNEKLEGFTPLLDTEVLERARTWHKEGDE